MEQNTVERVVKTERDDRSRIKRCGQARLLYVKRHKPQHPHHVKGNPQGRVMEKKTTTQQEINKYRKKKKPKKNAHR